MSDRVRKPIRIAIAALLVYWIALFILTHVPVAVRVPVTNWDKVAHLVAYAALSFLLACVLSRSDRSRKRLLVIVFVVGALYAAADELIQMLVPGRVADWYDWIADIFGIAVGLAIFHVLPSRWRTSARTKAKPSA